MVSLLGKLSTLIQQISINLEAPTPRMSNLESITHRLVPLAANFVYAIAQSEKTGLHFYNSGQNFLV